MIKPRYYKCDICNKATHSVALIKTKGKFTLDKGSYLLEGLNGMDIVICDNCFNKLIKKINAELKDGE